MANDDKPLAQTSKVGVFDKNLEPTDNGKNLTGYRLGALPDIQIPDNFDDIELSDFEDGDDYPK